MTMLEQWEQRKRTIQRALAEGRMSEAVAAQQLAHLDYRIKRRPLVLKRRKDRKAWRRAQMQQRHTRGTDRNGSSI